jgi:hypothetical protein
LILNKVVNKPFVTRPTCLKLIAMGVNPRRPSRPPG